MIAPAVHAQVMFAYSAGPLAWSIVAFRNSLVFHSLDKVCLATLPSRSGPATACNLGRPCMTLAAS